MSTCLHVENRVSVLEQRQLNLEVRIEGLAEEIKTGIERLSADMTASFKLLTSYLIKIEESDKRFNRIETDIAHMKEDNAHMRRDIAHMKGDILTTQGDITNMKGDITDIKGALKQHTVLFNQMLERLSKIS
jgi:chromosome segregation ATPase